MLQFFVDKPQSIKDFTDNNYAQASFVFRTLLKAKEIRVNGKKTDKDILLRVGDCVEYYLTKKQAEKCAYTVEYEDENVIIVDKDSGVNSEAVFAGLRRSHGEFVRFIHRLDRNTQGVLVFAKTDNAERLLLEAFKAHTVKKVYHALCFGKLPAPSGVLTAYLKKDESRSIVRIFDAPTTGAEKIVMEYKLLAENSEMSKVEVTLHTGKTHQIRAHMAHVGCPVVGDMKYGNEEKNRAVGLSRQCLVAKYLGLGNVFPSLKDKIFTSKFNVDFTTLRG